MFRSTLLAVAVIATLAAGNLVQRTTAGQAALSAAAPWESACSPKTDPTCRP